jgi:hypothetical protein
MPKARPNSGAIRWKDSQAHSPLNGCCVLTVLGQLDPSPLSRGMAAICAELPLTTVKRSSQTATEYVAVGRDPMGYG